MAVALAAASFIGATASASVINGSFEEGVPGNTPGIVNGLLFDDLPSDPSGFDVYGAVNGWTTVKGSGVGVHTANTLPTIDAQDGDYYAELDGVDNAAIFQNVGLHVGRYVLSFWYSPQNDDTRTNGIIYRLSGVLSGKVDNMTVGATVGAWTQISVEFLASTARSYRLTFAAIGKEDGIGGLIDNVEIAPVPLPASGLALLAALGGIAALRRRKTA
jgi:hypothetical protein